jgi:hypothetical protein
MKSAYLLLAAGFAAVGLPAGGCVSADPVGGNGGQTGNNGSGGHVGNNGSGGGSSFGTGGFTGSGQGGFVGGGQGGFVGGGQGGFVGGGQGGSTGAAGSGVSGCPRSVPDIDNFDETGRGGPATGGYFNLNCAMGSWYTYGDGTATVTPPTMVAFVSDTPGHGGAGYAAHISGTGFNSYGVGLGVNLNSSGAVIKNVDASAYSGFTFWAMGTAAGALTGTNAIRIAVPIPASADAANGGTCTATAPMSYCNGHWGKVINLTTAWAQYTVKWSELTLDMNSVGGTSFTPGTVIGFHWQANGTATMPASINVWVDDLAFTP